MIDPDNSVFDQLFVITVSGIALGAMAVIAGAYTAPKYKFHTAVVISVLMVFFLGITFAYTIGTERSLWDIWSILMSVGGAVGGVYYVYDEWGEGLC